MAGSILMNNRQKGLQYVREVKAILEKQGWIVDGPMYKPIFIKGRSTAVHSDFFGLFDLISYLPNEFVGYYFHQISLDEKRAEKIKAILKAGVAGFFWGRGINEKRVGFWVYAISPKSIYENIITNKIFIALNKKGK